MQSLGGQVGVTPKADEFNILLIGHSQALGKITDTDTPVYSDLVPQISMPDAEYYDFLSNDGGGWQPFTSSPWYMSTTGRNGVPPNYGYGVEHRLAQKLLENTVNKVNLVKYAITGTSFTEGTKPYFYTDPNGITANDGLSISEIKARTDSANIHFHSVVLIFGENDALYLTQANAFENQLDVFIERMSTYFSFDQFMVVESPSIYPDYTNTPYISTIQSAQLSVTQSRSDALFVPKLDPLAGKIQTDLIHYNATGINEVAINIYDVIAANKNLFTLTYS